jgi:hypothetical protein
VSGRGDQGEDPALTAALRRRLRNADEGIPLPADLHRRIRAARPRAGRSSQRAGLVAVAAAVAAVVVLVLSLRRVLLGPTAGRGRNRIPPAAVGG